MIRPVLFLFFGLILLGCGETSSPPVDTLQVPPPPLPATQSYSCQLFEIIDSTGTMHGVGYDIYNGDKRMIHQVNIPGEPGNDGFVNREEAAKVAQLVITKLQSASGFPTITREELDSLGITLQPHQ